MLDDIQFGTATLSIPNTSQSDLNMGNCQKFKSSRHQRVLMAEMKAPSWLRCAQTGQLMTEPVQLGNRCGQAMLGKIHNKYGQFASAVRHRWCGMPRYDVLIVLMYVALKLKKEHGWLLCFALM